MSEATAPQHEHRFALTDVNGKTWSTCVDCRFAELWADGQLIATTDEAESARLDEAGLIHEPAPPSPSAPSVSG